MLNEIFLLRVSYWSAALADFAIAGLVLMPERMGTAETVYPMGIASAIAFSWGVLLLLADRKPMDRRWILPPTILVVALLLIARLRFSMDGSIEFSPFWLVFGFALLFLMAYSYYSAGKRSTDT